jgi:hypothetical protein
MTKESLSDRDEAYKILLHHGVVRLRELLHLGKSELALIEVEHLHNVPSLIAEANLRRHEYYFNKEKSHYQAMLDKKGTEQDLRFIRIFYDPCWKTLELFLEQNQ